MMTDIWTRMKKAAAGTEEEGIITNNLYPIIVESGAISQVAAFMLDKSYQRVVVVADANTYEAAGKTLIASLTDQGIFTHLTIIKPNAQGDVIADEVALIQLIMDIQQYAAEIVVAAGSGTLHDIARYSAYTAGISFVSVPTAPSVDGFNSKGAPIIIRGEKKTIAAISPDAIFADLDILMGAPAPMVASGFGDMLGKYTSLFDWKFGSLVAGEPYSLLVAQITSDALKRCIDHQDSIAKRDKEGIRTLIEALIESGIAMMIFGQSHSASGSEHHLSHYWEMEYIRIGKRQLLHGAKVGVACAEISSLYHRLADSGFMLEQGVAAAEVTFGENVTVGGATGEQAMVEKAAGEKATVERATAKETAAEVASKALQLQTNIESNWADIQREIRLIPNEQTIRELLQKVGGPITPAQLGVSEELLRRSLREAHNVRPNRYTMLRAYNELVL
jgi:glycerol-1-phosphate dehydrogenase [NAD(P)+]